MCGKKRKFISRNLIGFRKSRTIYSCKNSFRVVYMHFHDINEAAAFTIIVIVWKLLMLWCSPPNIELIMNYNMTGVTNWIKTNEEQNSQKREFQSTTKISPKNFELISLDPESKSICNKTYWNSLHKIRSILIGSYCRTSCTYQYLLVV